MIAVIIIVVLLIVLGLVFAGLYNSLISLRNKVQEAWAQIDVELKRRHDLIGNLVETVKGYAAHEKDTLEEITRARSAAMAPGQGPAEASKSEAALSQAMLRLNAVAEAYPDLKANTNFTALQNELSSTEDRIASARRYYNANVRELNTKVESVPTNFIAGMAGVTKAEYFEVEDTAREVPQVNFGTPAGTPTATTPGSGSVPPAGATPSLPQQPATPSITPEAYPQDTPQAPAWQATPQQGQSGQPGQQG